MTILAQDLLELFLVFYSLLKWSSIYPSTRPQNFDPVPVCGLVSIVKKHYSSAPDHGFSTSDLAEGGRRCAIHESLLFAGWVSEGSVVGDNTSVDPADLVADLPQCRHAASFGRGEWGIMKDSEPQKRLPPHQ